MELLLMIGGLTGIDLDVEYINEKLIHLIKYQITHHSLRESISAQ